MASRSQTCSFAQTAKPCEELKSEISTKLEAKGVKGYSLEIVAKEQDVTPHSFMLEAIREKLEAEEARLAFHF